ncbi:hypothetical protein W823_09580 [Williamsia sp. D3]|nr:hypothetical protein W823_09580 [Williamsia sp. D3]
MHRVVAALIDRAAIPSFGLQIQKIWHSKFVMRNS